MVKGAKRKARKLWLSKQPVVTVAELYEAGVMVQSDDTFVLAPKYNTPEYAGLTNSQLLAVALADMK